jgi:hypothetical protein
MPPADGRQHDAVDADADDLSNFGANGSNDRGES